MIIELRPRPHRPAAEMRRGPHRLGGQRRHRGHHRPCRHGGLRYLHRPRGRRSSSSW